MAVTIALAIITGRPLLGEKIWRRGSVAIVSYEDDADEWHRRIAAACVHHVVDYRTALENIRFIVKPRDKICFSGAGEGDEEHEDSNEIIEILQGMNAALLIIDPFNHTHGYDDGNANVLIARVASEMNRVAQESQAAVMVLHHLRKGSTGQTDDMMGATSLRATFRSSRVLARMTSDEAKALGVDHDSWRYSRISGSKENYAPPPDKASWFKLESISLANVTDEYPDGDSVQVTTVWHPPGIADGITTSDLQAIFNAVEVGPAPGELFSPSKQSGNWVGDMIIRITGKNDTQVALLVKKWIENENFIEDSYISPKGRNKVKGIKLNGLKASVMAGNGWRPKPDGEI